MNHLFIVNPIAGGKRHDYHNTIGIIENAMEGHGGDYEIFITGRAGEAADKVRCEAERGTELRVYACGGDGTLHECVNGCVGHGNASVTSYPCGTGNDFIRLFGEDMALFYDMKRLINGFVHPLDVINCNGQYCVNICSVGFDARVGTDVHKYTSLPFVSGTGGYIISLIANFFKGINQQLTIRVGNEIYEGEFALVCACNGRFYGGGFNPIKDSMPNDGVMDTLIVKKCSRLEFVTFIKKYAAGQYYKAPELVSRVDSDYIKIEADRAMAVNLDGELMKTETVTFKMVYNGVNFICPEGMIFCG